jgi:hypothetical protein
MSMGYVTWPARPHRSGTVLDSDSEFVTPDIVRYWDNQMGVILAIFVLTWGSGSLLARSVSSDATSPRVWLPRLSRAPSLATGA